MAKYLILYRADREAQEQMVQSTPEQMQTQMEAWGAWAGRAGAALIDFGSPVVATAGHADNTIGGFSVLEAVSHDELAGLLEGHPHLEVGTIDSHEFLPMPGM